MYLNKDSYKTLLNAKKGLIHPKQEKEVRAGKLIMNKHIKYKYVPSLKYQEFTTKAKSVSPVSLEERVEKFTKKQKRIDTLLEIERRIQKIEDWIENYPKTLVGIRGNKAIFKEKGK
jgi:hypothetical protein